LKSDAAKCPVEDPRHGSTKEENISSEASATSRQKLPRHNQASNFDCLPRLQ
jgi:hypothetical protein